MVSITQKLVVLSLTGILIIFVITLKNDYYFFKELVDGISKETTSEQSNDWKDLIKCQELRITRLRKVCKELNMPTQLNVYSEEELKYIVYKFISDENNKLILKAIPKTGCTSWKSMLIDALFVNSSKKIGPHQWDRINERIGTLNMYTKPEILKRLTNYFLILTIRHPLSRLESGFKNRWLNRTPLKKASVSEKFDHFLDTAVLKPNEGDKGIMEDNVHIHWINYTEHAHPCLLPNMFIAKTETATQDMNYITDTKLHGIAKAVQLNPSNKVTNITIQLNEGYPLPLFSSLPNLKERIDTLMELNVFGADMKLFGYGYKYIGDQIIATCDNVYKGMCC